MTISARARRYGSAELLAVDVIDVLTDGFITLGIPAFIRSDRGTEVVARAVHLQIAAVRPRPRLTNLLTVEERLYRNY